MIPGRFAVHCYVRGDFRLLMKIAELVPWSTALAVTPIRTKESNSGSIWSIGVGTSGNGQFVPTEYRFDTELVCRLRVLHHPWMVGSALEDSSQRGDESAIWRIAASRLQNSVTPNAINTLSNTRVSEPSYEILEHRSSCGACAWPSPQRVGQAWC